MFVAGDENTNSHVQFVYVGIATSEVRGLLSPSPFLRRVTTAARCLSAFCQARQLTKNGFTALPAEIFSDLASLTSL